MINVEHRPTGQIRDVVVDHPVYPSTRVQIRYVCTCGVATRWCPSDARAVAEFSAHATIGQRELAL